MDNKNPKYNSLAEWKKAEPKAYLAAKNKGLLDEICNLFGWSSKIKLLINLLFITKRNRFRENQSIFNIFGFSIAFKVCKF